MRNLASLHNPSKGQSQTKGFRELAQEVEERQGPAHSLWVSGVRISRRMSQLPTAGRIFDEPLISDMLDATAIVRR
jgi:hypothetical protein